VRVIAVCAFVMLVALMVVGIVSHGILRHTVQTLPFWFVIGLGLRDDERAKWTGLPCFAFWLLCMALIWMYLLRWARIITGSFSPIEIAMTIVVGVAAFGGLLVALRSKTSTKASTAIGLMLVTAAAQVALVRISFLPVIAFR
jgi:hypothetical protein